MSGDPREWIAVAALPGLGAASVKRLWDQGWTPARLIDGSLQDWQRLGLKSSTIGALQQYQAADPDSVISLKVNQVLTWLDQTADGYLLPLTHPDYPLLLKQIHDPPPILFVKGNPHALALPQIAIVGSRSASAAGLRQTAEWVHHLAGNGLSVCSGLALGIDAAAHQACVDMQTPTLAVLGTGLARPYPQRNLRLAEQIIEQGGAWISELFPPVAPLAANFPRRNRIISGISLGVLVVEAALRSGSLITARQAMEQGREVFAIPGSIHNPLSKGCHLLIKEGAKLVESAADIIEPLSPMLGYLADNMSQDVPDTKIPCPLTPQQQSLLDWLGYERLTLDQLSSCSDLDVAELSACLTELELLGLVEHSPAGYQRC